MDGTENKILYIDDILKAKEYKEYFKNEVCILDSFIMNNSRLFRLDARGKLYIRKRQLDNALNPVKVVKADIETEDSND